MAVRVKGDSNTAVPQPFTHYLWMDTLPQHKRGMSVPQVMETNPALWNCRGGGGTKRRTRWGERYSAVRVPPGTGAVGIRDRSCNREAQLSPDDT